MATSETSTAVPTSTTTAPETTAAPTSTTLPAEVSSVVPDSTAEKSATETIPAPPDTATAPASEPAKVDGATDPVEGGEKATEATAPAPVEAKKATPIEELWALAQSKGHPEIWGVTLADPATHIPTQVILQKYLNANDGDFASAKDQLTKTLEWRAKMKPLDLLNKKFNRAKFEGLGYVTTFGAPDADDAELKEVFTWNIYGRVKNVDETFGNLAEFIEWRVVLMEEALQALAIDKATKPITAEWDPYKIFQVHDYKSISFLRQQSVVKAASTETIKIFAQNYPELLKEKFFVNVPAIMGFIYTFIKLFVAAKTAKKFHPMSNAANLAAEMSSSKVKGLGGLLPKEYGGTGAPLSSAGKQPALEDEPKPVETEAAAAAEQPTSA